MTTTDLADTIAAAETLARAGHPYELRRGRLGTFVTLLDGEGDSLSVQLDERCAGRHCAEHPRPTPADLDTWAEDSPYTWPAETETALRGGLRGDARKRYAEGLAETGHGVRERLERARGTA